MMTANASSPGLPAFDRLAQVFGEASQNAFGSAVFFEPGPRTGSLEQEALGKYEYFCGETWARFGPENWMATWQHLHGRERDSNDGIESELRGLADREAQQAAEMLLETGSEALKAAFDDPGMTQLEIFKIGDGGAMSGILIAAEHDSGRLFLVFLLD